MATTNGHIPNGHPKKEERPRDVFRISGLIAILCCVPLPLFAFVVCIVLSVMNDFEESTYTTCSDPAAGKVCSVPCLSMYNVENKSCSLNNGINYNDSRYRDIE